jgi:hypothetical protein
MGLITISQQGTLIGIEGHCALRGEQGLGMICFVINFHHRALAGAGGHLWIEGGGGTLGHHRWVGPLRQASDSVSDRFTIRWIQYQMGLESEGYGIR